MGKVQTTRPSDKWGLRPPREHKKSNFRHFAPEKMESLVYILTSFVQKCEKTQFLGFFQGPRILTALWARKVLGVLATFSFLAIFG